jgi:RND family efflux transporter MFP subunit
MAMVVAGCSKPDAPSPSKGGPPGGGARKARVTLHTAETHEVEYAIDASGSIEAAEEISIPARVPGVIDVLSFKQGDTVDEKTVLCEIEVERYRLAAARIEADLERAKAQATLAETMYSNRLKLYEEGKKQGKEWVTEEQMAQWRADLDKAKADVARVTADLELARRDHANSRVRSPIAGIINTKPVSRGEYVKAETVIATMLNVSTLHVQFTLPELEASRLAPKQEITFSIRSVPDRLFKARLFYTSQKADASTRSIECKAEILERHENLRTNLFASVRIVTNRKSSVVVPDRAVLPTERGFVVWAVDGQNRAKSRVVKLGLRTADGVEIVDGLAAGEKIAVDGAATLKDGVEVEPPGPPREPPKDGASPKGGAK